MSKVPGTKDYTVQTNDQRSYTVRDVVSLKWDSEHDWYMFFQAEGALPVLTVPLRGTSFEEIK